MTSPDKGHDCHTPPHMTLGHRAFCIRATGDAAAESLFDPEETLPHLEPGQLCEATVQCPDAIVAEIQLHQCCAHRQTSHALQPAVQAHTTPAQQSGRLGQLTVTALPRLLLRVSCCPCLAQHPPPLKRCCCCCCWAAAKASLTCCFAMTCAGGDLDAPGFLSAKCGCAPATAPPMQ